MVVVETFNRKGLVSFDVFVSRGGSARAKDVEPASKERRTDEGILHSNEAINKNAKATIRREETSRSASVIRVLQRAKQKPMHRLNEVCPLLVPQDSRRKRFCGFISVGV